MNKSAEALNATDDAAMAEEENLREDIEEAVDQNDHEEAARLHDIMAEQHKFLVQQHINAEKLHRAAAEQRRGEINNDC
jgi:hypothetical protein